MRTSACGLEGHRAEGAQWKVTEEFGQCRDRPALFGILKWLRFAGGGIQPVAANYGLGE